MLRRGYLATTYVVVSYAHTDAVLDTYLGHVEQVFAQLATWLHAAGGDVGACRHLLQGPIKHGGPRIAPEAAPCRSRRHGYILGI